MTDDQRGWVGLEAALDEQPMIEELLEAPEYAYEDTPAVRLWVSFFQPAEGGTGPDTVDVSWRVAPSVDEMLSVLNAVIGPPPASPSAG